MQSKKLVAALLAILIVGISSPALIPRGHADDTNMSLSSTGYIIKNVNDPNLGTVDAVKAGSTLSFTLEFVASSAVFQRNVSLGIKFDWMNTFQNSSMANSGSTYTIFANQIAYLTLNATIPNLTGQYSGLNLVRHNWQIQVWDGPANSAWSNFCGFDNNFGPPYTACRSFFNSNSLAIYSSTQASGILARQQATTEITAIKASQGVYCFSGATCNSQPTPGTASVAAQLAAAATQLQLGDNAYQIGDFNDANNDYQNSLNDANAAQSSLGTVGGGTDTATLSSIWIEAVAILFGGIGALLVGIAGFKYLRSRAKAYTSYSPASSPKP